MQNANLSESYFAGETGFKMACEVGKHGAVRLAVLCNDALSDRIDIRGEQKQDNQFNETIFY